MKINESLIIANIYIAATLSVAQSKILPVVMVLWIALAAISSFSKEQR